jgi:processive 1,2-diacylglycerol beta-glucosyltransferase
MLKNVLILSASAGAGHVRAAEAIERALHEKAAAEDVRHVDVLQHTNPLFRQLYSKAYLDMVQRIPEVLGWLYDRMDSPDFDDRLKQAFDKLNVGPFVKLLEKYQPEIAVCTHSLPAEIIAWLARKGRLDTKQAIVITDFDVHALWLCAYYEHYFVAIDETRAHLEELGIARQKIAVTGIPIDPVFATPKDKAAMRAKHGLDPDRPTILVSAGGFGVGRIDEVMTSLHKLRHRAQVIVICGKNVELKDRMHSLTHDLAPGHHVHVNVVGYTTEIDEYMAASDLIVGKPGGLTTSEALARGLVYVVVNPIPGQEERNSDHLLEEGAAIRCNNLPVLAYKINRLLDDENRLAIMRANALRLGRPRSALDVVDHLLARRPETAPHPVTSRRLETNRRKRRR